MAIEDIVSSVERIDAHASALLSSRAARALRRMEHLEEKDFLNVTPYQRAFAAGTRVALGNYPAVDELYRLKQDVMDQNMALLVLITDESVPRKLANIGRSAVAIVNHLIIVVEAVRERPASERLPLDQARECIAGWLETYEAGGPEFNRVAVYVEKYTDRVSRQVSAGTLGSPLSDRALEEARTVEREIWSEGDEATEGADTQDARVLSDIKQFGELLDQEVVQKSEQLAAAADAAATVLGQGWRDELIRRLEAQREPATPGVVVRQTNPGELLPLCVIAAVMGGTLGTVLFANDAQSFLGGAAIAGIGTGVLLGLLRLIAQRGRAGFTNSVDDDSIAEGYIADSLPWATKKRLGC